MSAEFWIMVSTEPTRNEPTMYAEWFGDPHWISAPHTGALWVHCGDWTAEEIYRVYFNGPDDNRKSAITVEIRTTPDVIDHLVAAHGFIDPYPVR